MADASSRWFFLTEWLISLLSRIGLSSIFETLFANSYLQESAKLLVLGSIIETGRRLCQWLIERFRFQYFLSARFDEGDPAYEWLVLFLTEEDVWKKSRDFIVTSRSSRRKWAVTSGPGAAAEGNADYVPSFGAPQLFRWRGHWVEVTRLKDSAVQPYGVFRSFTSLQLIIYTREMSVLSDLVEEARIRYNDTSKQNVTIHSVDSPNYGPGPLWNNVKAKLRRPLSSLILEEGFIESLISDANEFFDMEEWYVDAGIPHRRGYLLYGPPGTGKTSTVYALAGELGLEIYSLSLASDFIDDPFLQRAVSSIPKHSLLLIEDIDCAFPSREDAEELEEQSLPVYHGIGPPPFGMRSQSKVTLSGLLNIIDGINSEDGKLFFATTNHIDRLDTALLRPGRIDKRIQYKMATRQQAGALYRRFFPESRFADIVSGAEGSHDEKSLAAQAPLRFHQLAEKFAECIPEDEFTTAELQGYLLMCKMKPLVALSGVTEWVEQERAEKREREEREARRKEKLREMRLKAKTAVIAEMVGPIQQQAATNDASSTVAKSTAIGDVSDEKKLTDHQPATLKDAATSSPTVPL